MKQTLYACQTCGEEFSDGEADRNGRHAYCGGEGDPIGEVDDGEDETEQPDEEA